MVKGPLALQDLGRQADQVILVASLLAERGSDGFRAVDVVALFKSLRVPPPKNVHQVMADLGKKGFLIPLSKGRWDITPRGKNYVITQVSQNLPEVDLLREPSEVSPTFGDRVHHVIPPELAPASLAKPVGDFLERHQFEHNVFGITRYPKSPSDPISGVLQTCKVVLSQYSLEFHLASDKSITDQLWPNVAASIWACRFGVAVLEDRVGEGLNPNVLIELGAMLVIGRRCVILKDVTVPRERIPTDLIGHIYKEIDIGDIDSVERAVRSWCESDLGLE